MACPKPPASITGKFAPGLNSLGQPIGNNDLWLAAHARAEGWILVTNNEREFIRVPGCRSKTGRTQVIEDRLTAELADIAAAGLTRRRRVLESPCGRIAAVNGREMLNFASNDYLGLAGNAEIAAALADGATLWGAGSGASHLVSGHLAPHEALETELAAFTGFPRALTFSTGYLANLAMMPTLATRGSVIFSDRLNHASMIDADAAWPRRTAPRPSATRMATWRRWSGCSPRATRRTK